MNDRRNKTMIPELNASMRRKPGRRGVVSGLAAAGLAAVVAACGGPGGIYGTTSGGEGTAHHTAASRGNVISARDLPGIGTVLVDRSGKTLYTPRQEAHGKIMCTGGCLSFWFPASVAAGAAVHAPSGVTGVLSTIHRPDDGLTQLTYNGKPLYTFRLDQAPGQAHGNNVNDQFGSASFTWHAVTASGATGIGQAGSTGGYSAQGGSGGY
jgi:predicted lipoprotein with Yx(FWY)xxD motif